MPLVVFRDRDRAKESESERERERERQRERAFCLLVSVVYGESIVNAFETSRER